MITEIVLYIEEFLNLSQGQVRYVVEQQSCRYEDEKGIARQSPETRIIANLTAISKAKDPQRIICMKIDCGTTWPQDKAERIAKVHEAILKDWPGIKEGLFQ